MDDEVLQTTTVGPFLRSLLGGSGNGNETRTLNETTTIGALKNITSNTTTHMPRIANLEIHRTNIVWPEDPADEIPINFPRFYDHYANNRRLHMSALVPFGVMLVLSTIIFIMIIFRRWPGLVSGIVAGCLTFISIYLLLLTLKEEVLVYE